MKNIFDGFGYELWLDENDDLSYKVLDGEGTEILATNDRFYAKRWMKEHKTSECWRADGKWDWSRLEA